VSDSRVTRIDEICRIETIAVPFNAASIENYFFVAAFVAAAVLDRRSSNNQTFLALRIFSRFDMLSVALYGYESSIQKYR